MNPDKGFVVVLRCHSGKLMVSNRETKNPGISGKLLLVVLVFEIECVAHPPESSSDERRRRVWSYPTHGEQWSRCKARYNRI
jgi:hypothetical protein